MRKSKNPVFPEPAGLWPRPMPERCEDRRSDAERRIAIERGCWIDHPAARDLTVKLLEFAQRPWQDHQRWRGMLFVGDSNNGRSSLISRTIARGARYDPEKPVVVRLSWPMSEGRFWSAIIEGTGRARHGGSILDLRCSAMQALERRATIVFDGADPLADADVSPWPLLAKLKALGEDRRIPVVLVLPPKAAAKVAAHKDWGDRFEVARLPRWRVDGDYLDLLDAWEAALPLKEASHLADREMALHLYSLCDGKIGALERILRTASLAAIESATERITVPQLDNLGLAPPSSFAGFRF